MTEVWIAVARNGDDSEDYVQGVGITEAGARVALDGLLESMYNSWCDGMEAADCGTLKEFRDRYVFDTPEEHQVRPISLKVWVATAVYNVGEWPPMIFTGVGRTKEGAENKLFEILKTRHQFEIEGLGNDEVEPFEDWVKSRFVENGDHLGDEDGFKFVSEEDPA